MKYLMILVLLAIFTGIFAQDMDFIPRVEKPKEVNKKDSLDINQLKNDIIHVNYNKKIPRRAALYSAIVPGAGQFYASSDNYYALIFPIIELALAYGIYSYTASGDDIEADYQRFADDNYKREAQRQIQEDLMGKSTVDIYNDQHFRLDATNTQHFYEDIGKYNKYIFGWTDWYEDYAPSSSDEAYVLDHVYWTFSTEADESERKWTGNRITEGGESFEPDSKLRSDYIQMRQDAEAEYDVARMCKYGIILNHLAAAIDAVRVTKKHNREYLSQKPYDFGIRTAYLSGRPTPFLNLTARF